MESYKSEGVRVRVGINGMGRIGRMILREWVSRKIPLIDIVACNSLGSVDDYAFLLKYDSVHGVYPENVSVWEKSSSEKIICIGKKKVSFFSCQKPSEVPWAREQVDIVLDATGVFKDRDALSGHMEGASVKKVIMCAPGKNLDGTFVMGINHQKYSHEGQHIVSNASCTTNCLSPVVKVLQESFGVVSGFMTTVHAYTLDQATLDTTHSDMRRGRTAALNMIPTTTGAARMVGEVIPSLKGKLDGHAVRVPTANVSLVDLSVNLEKQVKEEDIHGAMKEASTSSSLGGILGYSDLPLVSQDFLGRRESAIYDAPLTKVVDGAMAKITAWYDNEVGFSNRVIDLAGHIGQQFKKV